jgi:hypothetical protein
MTEEVCEMFIRQTEVPDPEFPWYLVSYAPFSTVVKIYSRHKTYEEAKEARTEENLIGGVLLLPMLKFVTIWVKKVIDSAEKIVYFVLES